MSHTTSLLITHRLQDAFTLATHRYNNDAEGKMEPIPDGKIDDSTKFLVLHEGKEGVRWDDAGADAQRRSISEELPDLRVADRSASVPQTCDSAMT